MSLVEVENLVVRYPVPRGIVGTVARRPRQTVHAVDGVSFSLGSGEILALVGESGCGKTTTAQTLLRLVEPEAGSIRFEGRDVTRLSTRELPSGCPFHPRCPAAVDVCPSVDVSLWPAGVGRRAACVHVPGAPA